MQFDILSFLFVLKLFFTEYFLFQKLFEMLLLVNTVTKLNLKSFISRKELGNNLSSLVKCIYFVHFFFFVSNSNIDVQFNLKCTYKTPVQTKRTNWDSAIVLGRCVYRRVFVIVFRFLESATTRLFSRQTEKYWKKKKIKSKNQISYLLRNERLRRGCRRVPLSMRPDRLCNENTGGGPPDLRYARTYIPRSWLAKKRSGPACQTCRHPRQRQQSTGYTTRF